MIPLHLKIKGLYSYQAEQTIDFEKLTEASLFGIFGVVGSGKSAILEAIMFALYGDTERLNKSGDDRNYNMMNLSSNELYIEFICLAGVELNRYKFIVQGRRNSKNFKDVKTFDRKSYRLLNDVWEPLLTDDIAEKIIELSYENFRRTVIIPQGRFQEFIELQGTARSKMMKTIFNLERFDLFDKTNTLLSQNKEKLSVIDANLQAIGDISEALIHHKKQTLALKKEAIIQTEAELLKLRADEKTYDETNKIFKKLFETQQQLAQLQGQANSIKQRNERLLLFEKCLINYQVLLQQKNTHSIEYQRLNGRLNATIVHLKTENDRFDILKTALEQVRVFFDKKDIYRLKAKEYQSVGQLISIQKSSKVLEERIAIGEKIAQDAEQKIELAKKDKHNTEAFLIKTKKSQKVFEESYEHALSQLLVQQSLQQYAHALKPAQPCPLCGSLQHPEILSLEQNFEEKIKIMRLEKRASQEKIESIERKIKDIERQIESESQRLSQKYLPTLNQLRAEIAQNKGKELGLIDNLSIFKIEDFAEKTLEEIAELGQKSSDNYIKIVEKFEYLDKENRQIEGEIRSLNGSVSTLKESQNNLEKIIKDLNVQIQMQLTTDAFESEAWVANILKQSIDLAKERDEIQQFQLQIEVMTQSHVQLQNDSDGKQYDEASHLKIKQKIISKELSSNSLRKEEGSLEQEISILDEKLALQKVWIKDKKSLETRKQNLDTLQKLFKANGFVDFVSSKYLSNLCQVANSRFHAMTHQQLHLEINEDNDFEVRDLLNGGHSRLLKTLSGGQKFQAALSLALALADNVQALQHRRQNFFFLDEGFGTLDKESLYTVFETLKSLRKENRIIGIISHVEELQQEIYRYITVRNDAEKGSIVNYFE